MVPVINTPITIQISLNSFQSTDPSFKHGAPYSNVFHQEKHNMLLCKNYSFASLTNVLANRKLRLILQTCIFPLQYPHVLDQHATLSLTETLQGIDSKPSFPRSSRFVSLVCFWKLCMRTSSYVLCTCPYSIYTFGSPS